MLATLTDEQLLLVETAARIAAFVGPRSPTELVAPAADGWVALAEAGLLGLRLPDEGGRPVGTALDGALVVERLAARCCASPFVGAGLLAPELLRLAGAPPGLSEELADGGRRLTVALTPDLGALAGDGPSLAWDAAGCDGALCLLDEGFGLRPLATAVASADLTRTIAEVDAAVPFESGRGVLSLEASPEVRQRWEAFALAMLSADLVGAMDGAVAAGVDHVREREQFGRPVGSFQAVQHLLADAHVRVEAARSAMWFAAWAVDERPTDEALLAARVAKAYAAPAARDVAEAVIQAFGGMGMTYECLAHAYLRRVLVTGAVLGGEATQLDRIAATRLGEST
ncbi:MAG: hypothetical protein MUF83_16440 [Acidimicrobiales bacterium]|nr:hypothetical protein [Acidimicrobiales bacterium]